jgi:LPXTG-motif cell wall-anchored protein
MFNKSKKVFLIFAIVFILAQILTVAASALEIQVKKGKPTLDGIFEPGEWDDNGKFVMDKACVLAYNGMWPDASDMTDNRGVTCYLLWDSAGLYMGLDIKDNTPTWTETWDAHGDAGGTKSDMFQIVFFAQDEAKWIDVAMYKDGKLAPRGHDSDFDDNNFEGKLTGKGTVKPDGSGYYIECFMPWELVNVAADYKEGLSIPVLFMYVDMDGEDQTFYKSIDVDIWPPSDEVDIFMILSGDSYSPPAAAQPEAAPEVPDEPEVAEQTVPVVDTPPPAPASGPKTGDGTIFVLLVGFAAICVVFATYKKRKA